MGWDLDHAGGEADFEKDMTSGWREGTEIAADQLVAHVESLK
jgi:hypothetical protein